MSEEDESSLDYFYFPKYLPLGFTVDEENSDSERYFISFKNGKIYTADTFVTDLKQINIELENVCACEMEGTSIAQACYLLDTKFVSIRFISDIVGTEEQVKDYGTFEKLMANKSANICFDIVSKIK